MVLGMQIGSGQGCGNGGIGHRPVSGMIGDVKQGGIQSLTQGPGQGGTQPQPQPCPLWWRHFVCGAQHLSYICVHTLLTRLTPCYVSPVKGAY